MTFAGAAALASTVRKVRLPRPPDDEGLASYATLPEDIAKTPGLVVRACASKGNGMKTDEVREVLELYRGYLAAARLQKV
jgi:hypothetical protein